MRWRGGRESENVEDDRGRPVTTAAIGGGMGTLVIVVIALLLGADPRQILQFVANNQQRQQAPAQPGQPGPKGSPEEEERVQFVKVVLADTEDVWTELFQKIGRNYEEPKLHLFTDSVNSQCGMADAAVGPFYCPGDASVFLDISFFKELEKRFKSPGDFAQAYVVAHEVGHHIQNLLGTNQKFEAARRQADERGANALSVRMELQADFYAGVWAHHAQRMQNILEPGDVESALRAATAIGDDTLQRRSQGYVVPDSFTHGTSEQRVRWFRKGLETGDLRQGDTFNAEDL
ncbi:KPN_02809 family neutral zinc metallopeptidase [Singulisphaera sp. PoT]|uniref:KPN_02809 family neutral zinc metallopeptidase n=1 Tax=Singulisphaera sp. PoT TaxID=3411797 RepID=UPI003BF47A19